MRLNERNASKLQIAKRVQATWIQSKECALAPIFNFTKLRLNERNASNLQIAKRVQATWIQSKECPKGFNAKRRRGGKMCDLISRWSVSFSCFNGNVCLYFFVKKYSKNSGCRLAGRHLLCSQVASDILRSLRGLPLAVCRKCLGRQRLAALKHVSGFPAHCSTCSLRLRNAAISPLATNYPCNEKPPQE